MSCPVPSEATFCWRVALACWASISPGGESQPFKSSAGAGRRRGLQEIAIDALLARRLLGPDRPELDQPLRPRSRLLLWSTVAGKTQGAAVQIPNHPENQRLPADAGWSRRLSGFVLLDSRLTPAPEERRIAVAASLQGRRRHDPLLRLWNGLNRTRVAQDHRVRLARCQPG